jgi:hypothetical protein
MSAFGPLFLRQKKFKPKMSAQKLCTKLSFKKGACKMLVKLTRGGRTKAPFVRTSSFPDFVYEYQSNGREEGGEYEGVECSSEFKPSTLVYTLLKSTGWFI